MHFITIQCEPYTSHKVQEGDIEVCGIGEFFLRYFGNFNLEMRNHGILQTYGMLSFSILDGIKNHPPSPPTFSKLFPVFDWTFPMKLSSRDNGRPNGQPRQ